MNRALAALLTTLMAVPAAVAADPAPAAPPEHGVADAAGADTLARRRLLAEAFVTVSRYDDMLFSAIADQTTGFGSGRPGERDAAAEAAFKRLQPELREVAANALAESCSESTLRAAITFFASDAGQRFAADGAYFNGAMNHEATQHWQEWAKTIRDTPAPAAAEPAKSGKGF
jgi:hypothetical protein